MSTFKRVSQLETLTGAAHWLCTRSCARLLAFPQVNSTSPAVCAEAGRRVILWTAPLASSRTSGPGCSASPFRVHTADTDAGAESSHSKEASPGAETSTSSSSLMTVRDCAAPGEKANHSSLHAHVGQSQLPQKNDCFHFLFKLIQEP